jgi:hypothetical protein
MHASAITTFAPAILRSRRRPDPKNLVIPQIYSTLPGLRYGPRFTHKMQGPQAKCVDISDTEVAGCLKGGGTEVGGESARPAVGRATPAARPVDRIDTQV